MCWSESPCSGAGMRVDMARMTLQMDGDYQIRLMRMPSVLKHCKPLLLYSVSKKQAYYFLSLRACRFVIKHTRLEPVAVVDDFEGVVRCPSLVNRIRSTVVPKNSVRPIKRVSITRFISFIRGKTCACYQMLRNCSLVNLGKETLRLTERA